MKAAYTLAMVLIFASCSKNEQTLTPHSQQQAQLPQDRKTYTETEPPVFTAITKSINKNIGGYYEALPVHYKESGIKYPLLIFVHGAGQRGDGASQLARLTTEGITERLSKKQIPASFTSGKNKYSFVVLAPQFNEFESTAALESFINYAIKNYRIDQTRIYLTGMSMGGRMVCDYVSDYPDRAAAFITMAGVSKQDDAFEGKAKSIAGGKMGEWIIHNKSDEAMPPEDAQAMAEQINNNGPKFPAILTMLSPSGDANHDSWTRASNPDFKPDGMNIYEWLLQFSR